MNLVAHVAYDIGLSVVLIMHDALTQAGSDQRYLCEASSRAAELVFPSVAFATLYKSGKSTVGNCDVWLKLLTALCNDNCCRLMQAT